MSQIDWKQLTKRRVLGLVTMALGVFVLFSPVFIGEWVISPAWGPATCQTG